MKLCKKIEVVVGLNEIYFIRRDLSRCICNYYTNNIGPAVIIFDNKGIITKLLFLENNHYTHIPAMQFDETQLKVTFYSVERDWLDLASIINIKYYDLHNFPAKRYDYLKPIIEGIEKTNSFVRYLNQQNWLDIKLKLIDWNL